MRMTVRCELRRFLQGNRLSDDKAATVQVTSLSERTIELRALVSSGDAGSLFTLRTQVREAMIDFLQREYPESLPKIRLETFPETPSRKSP